MQRIKLTPIHLQYIVLIYFEVRWQFNLMKDVHIPSIIEIVITYFWTHNKKRKYKIYIYIYIYIYLEEIQNIIAVKSARTLRKWLKIG
jgi:hypothetical protein